VTAWLGGEADSLIATLRQQATRHVPITSTVIPWVLGEMTLVRDALRVPVHFECTRCLDKLEARYCCEARARDSIEIYAKLHAGCKEAG
jgi:hypothetical protein